MKGNFFDELSEPGCNKDLLYHYTTNDIAIKRILKNKQLKFNALNQYNDPVEFFDLTHIGTCSSINEKKIRNRVEKGRNINNIIKNGFRCASFSIDLNRNSTTQEPCINYNRGWARFRMWTQYAKNHTGVCIVFWMDKLLNSIKEDLKYNFKSEPSLLFDGCITYDNKLKKLNEALEIKDDSSQNTLIEKNKEGYLFTKLEDYRDEQEFRIAVYHKSYKKNGNAYELFYVRDAIKEIILGCAFPEVFRINLIEYAKKFGFDLFDIQWFNTKLYLEPIVLK